MIRIRFCPVSPTRGRVIVAGRAKGTIGIHDSAVNHAKVAIAANTVVLKDVEFHADSLVHLYSEKGMVSGNPGYRTSVVQGNVNILSNVKHGDYAIRFMNNGSTPDPESITKRP